LFAIGVDVAEPYEGEKKPPWTSTAKDQSGEPTLEWPTVQVDGLSYLSPPPCLITRQGVGTEAQLAN